MGNKKYVGKGKEVGQYGLINISLRADDLVPNERGYVNLTVGKMRNTDDRGNTHTVWVNDFIPVKRDEPKKMPDESYTVDGGLPF